MVEKAASDVRDAVVVGGGSNAHTSAAAMGQRLQEAITRQTLLAGHGRARAVLYHRSLVCVMANHPIGCYEVWDLRVHD